MAGDFPSEHILDPIAGYDGDLFENDHRLDYRRVELGSIIVLFDAAIESAVNLVRQGPVMWGLIAIAVTGALMFRHLARAAQRQPEYRPRWLIETFVVFVLLCSNGAGFLAGLEGRLTNGYSLTILAVAIFYRIPARRFMVIGTATYALFVGWTCSLEISFVAKVFPLSNTGLAVLAACFGRLGMDRIQQVGRRQRREIAEQNEALHRANCTLERQNHELNELMAIAAHDLRSPLFALRGVLDLAQTRPPASSDSLKKLLDAATGSVTSMLALVTRLLDVHEAEGRMPPTLRCVNLGQLLASAAERMNPMAEASGMRIDVGMPSKTVEAWGHTESIAQILENLLSNAIRFSPAGTTIRANTSVTPEGASIAIIDQGAGISQVDRPRLFVKFQRGATMPLHGPKGSGLGLFIVQVLCRSMGATCTFVPNPQGGAIFQVNFAPAGYPCPCGLDRNS